VKICHSKSSFAFTVLTSKSEINLND